jgi:threonine/homoserine/homoserine lactone efflux protein
MEKASLISFAGAVIIISLSGVLMPGPVTAVTVARGSRTPHAGAWVALGHGLVEWPLMALIFFGVRAVFKVPAVKIGLGAAGSLVLLWMGVGMLRDHGHGEALEEKGLSRGRSPFWSGALLSVANPYFLVWWGTAGAALVGDSLAFGLLGFFALAVCHWLCDLVWYYFLSALSFAGGKFFGQRLQRSVFIGCGLCLIYFAGYFAVRAALELMKT